MGCYTGRLILVHAQSQRDLLSCTGREERGEKKEVKDVGLETLGALFVNSHSDGEERKPAGTQRSLEDQAILLKEAIPVIFQHRSSC
ncbi:hypothetical protein AMECASPLE_016476 [Ameca splendens]|uniref:Uncharacterized protein n=1 Tax=Ameca splendens TaxID=208324 RepID=A0ABV1AB78_9TELE